MTSAVSATTSAYAYTNLSGSSLAKAATTATSGPTADNPLRQLFTAIDADGDGVLSRDDLASALSSSEDGADIDIDLILELLDSDAGGSISESEFAQAFAAPSGPPPGPPPASGTSPEEEAEALLSALDADGDGVISQEELAAAAADADTAGLFSALDADADGRLAVDELAAALQASRPPRPVDASGVDAITAPAGAGLSQAASVAAVGEGDDVVDEAAFDAALQALAANTAREPAGNSEASSALDLFRQLVVERYRSIAGNARAGDSLSTTA